jgi:hypothetical protein
VKRLAHEAIPDKRNTNGIVSCHHRETLRTSQQ